jgi:hypothetical protein
VSKRFFHSCLFVCFVVLSCPAAGQQPRFTTHLVNPEA